MFSFPIPVCPMSTSWNIQVTQSMIAELMKVYRLKCRNNSYAQGEKKELQDSWGRLYKGGSFNVDIIKGINMQLERKKIKKKTQVSIFKLPK